MMPIRCFAYGGLLALALTLFALPIRALQAQSVNELHKAAVKEGGMLNFYGTLPQVSAVIILPIFEKRFPGIKADLQEFPKYEKIWKDIFQLR